jgi:hypothetical protein
MLKKTNAVKKNKVKSSKKAKPTLEKRVLELEKALQEVQRTLSNLNSEKELADYYNK